MREIRVVVEDEGLCSAIERVAEETGFTFEEVAVRALELWKREDDLDEIDLAEMEADEAELRKTGIFAVE